MHQKPDADAMGSSLGLWHYLKKLGHSVTVVSPTNWAPWLNWMPGGGEVGPGKSPGRAFGDRFALLP